MKDERERAALVERHARARGKLVLRGITACIGHAMSWITRIPGTCGQIEREAEIRAPRRDRAHDLHRIAREDVDLDIRVTVEESSEGLGEERRGEAVEGRGRDVAAQDPLELVHPALDPSKVA